jgi:DNA modification methylase
MMELPINKILQGDALKRLKQLPDKSVHCIVTSPPYWGLRDYGTAVWKGGKADCSHVANVSKNFVFGNESFNKNRPSREETKTPGYYFKNQCGKCGARKTDYQVGLEETPRKFIAKLVKIFMECHRVLRDDGNLYIIIGDSYAASPKNRTSEQAVRKSTLKGSKGTQISCSKQPNKIVGLLKPKDLVGIPWLLAFALRDKGWYLREEIIWNKPNPMPESTKDRCTRAHEQIFHFTKSARYYYDYEAILQPVALSVLKDKRLYNEAYEAPRIDNGYPGNPSRGDGLLKRKSGNKERKPGSARGCPADNGANVMSHVPWEGHMANKKSVWTVTPKPFKEAHFAVYPPELISDPIKAGCPEGGIVLDPFFGAGTTGVVASKLGRNFIGIELNEKYIQIAEKRLQKELGLFR